MKKALIVIGIVLGSLLLLLGGSILLLQHNKVQTYIAGIIAERLSESLQVDIQIKHIHYRPLNNLTFDGFYISDQQRDTLIFVEHANIEIDLLQLRQQQLDLTKIQLQRPYINIQSLDDSTLNCQFLLNKLKRSDSLAFPLRVNIDQLQLNDVRFRYNDLLVDQFNLDLTLPVLSNDSIDITIHQCDLRAQLDRLDATFQTKLRGNLDSIFADELLLTYQDKRIFDGDIAIFQPTQLDSLYIQAHCNDLYSNHALLQNFLSQLLNKSIILPKTIATLGQVHYTGAIDGRLENLKLHGTFTTALGLMNVNGLLSTDTTIQNMNFHGHLSTNSFHIGKLLNNKDLGKIAFQTHADGEIHAFQLTKCTAQADISHIEYRGYTYQDIRFDGNMDVKKINGKLSINDENVTLQVNGLADWSEENTRLDITAQLTNLRPNAIHLIEDYADLSINAKTYISMSTFGTKQQILDNLSGHLIIDTLDIRNGDKQAMMEHLKLIVDNKHTRGKTFHKMNLQSDFLTANISGDFQYITLPYTIQHLLHTYLPTAIDLPKQANKQPNNLEFYAYFRQLDKISNVLGLPMTFTSFPTIKGFINEEKQQIGIQAHIPKIQMPKTQMEDLTISIENTNDSLDVAVYVYNRLPKNNPTVAKIGDVKARINFTAFNDMMNMKIQLDNTDSVRNAGTIHISSQLREYANKPLLDMHLHPTNIILNDSSWTIDDATITYATAENRLNIQNFGLKTNYQSIEAQGTASPTNADSIIVDLRNMNIQYLLSYTLVDEVITVQGPLTGTATLYNLFSQPMVEAEAYIPKAGLNGTYLGDVKAKAYLDRTARSIIIEGSAVDSMLHTIASVKGKVIPAEKWWGLNIHCDSVNINLIDSWTKGIFANPQGRAFGDLQVFGQNRKTWVTAKILGKDAHITIPELGTTYYFNDSVIMDSTSIYLKQIKVLDAEGHQGTFNGVITHTNFTDFHYDMDAYVNNILALDLPYDPQSLFYGKVYGTGHVNIKGDDYECKITVDARTEANSNFYLSTNTASVASNASSFIHFVEPKSTENNLLNLLSKPTQTVVSTIPKTTKLILSLQVEANPTTEVNIKLGGEDGIRGRGEGNVKITYDDSSEEIQMLGTYTLQSGVFTYTIGNIVRRNFDIAEGSKVIWDGDPFSPMVNITGRYHTTASLRDLFGSEFSQVATNRSSVPVNCVLYMTDRLFNPILNFAVELPQSDESVQSQVNSIINTQEMLMRQIIYLLVFNRFYTADYLQNMQSVGLNETYSLLSSTITGQINSWLSKLTDIFTMGFNFRTDGEGETASQEYEANFQIQPIRQLVINGNFGYRYNDLSNRPFFGDLDVEYLLTPNGKLRAKAYTHTVDKYSLRQANTVQGVGLVFKHDFNWNLQKKNKKAVKHKQK